MRVICAALVALGSVLGASEASAEAADKMRFDIYVQGKKSGDLRMQGRDKAKGSYAAQVALRLKGDLAARFEAKVAGGIDSGGYLPGTYSETSAIAGRSGAVRLSWDDAGVPSARYKGGPAEHWLTPDKAEATGVMDPATALWMLMQPRAAGDLCGLDLAIYDGARRMQLTTREPKPRGGAITCVGRVTREAGYSETELEAGASFAFEIEYQPSRGDLFRANRLTMPMGIGQVIALRR